MKQTEIGEIPEDWDVITLSEIADVDVENLNSQTHKDYEFNYISLEQVNQGRLLGTQTYLFKNAPSRARRVIRKHDVLVSTVRPNLKSHYWVDTDVKNTISSTGFSVVRPKKEKLASDFLFQHFFSSIINKQIDLLITGSNYPAINSKNVKELKIPLLSFSEQKLIAEVLTDTDNLIQATEQLINKKQLIKTATMQNLLTGKIRLAEFDTKKTKPSELGEIPSDWDVINLDKNFTLKARIGWQGLTTAEYLDSGDFYLVTGTDFKDGEIDWGNCFFVDSFRYKQDSNIQLKNGDILVTKDGTIGKVAYVSELKLSATLNSGVFVIRPKNRNKIDERFIYYIFRSFYFDNFLKKITAGSTIIHLYQKDFINFNFVLPSYSEQVEISKILTAMDKELTALNQRLAKLNDIKQGLMQSLLTGKIRLTE